MSILSDSVRLFSEGQISEMIAFSSTLIWIFWLIATTARARRSEADRLNRMDHSKLETKKNHLKH